MSEGFQGMDELRRKLARIGPASLQVGGSALSQVALKKLHEVRARTPIDKGDLRASEEVVGPEISGDSVSVRIVAGGPKAPHALVVHERLDVHHSTGQAKFLESVALESVPSLSADIAPHMDINRMVG